MSVQTVNQTQETILRRIDTIIRELEELRCQLTVTSKAAATLEKSSLTEELFGAAGHGTRDEYDLNLDWVRFSE